MIYITQVFITVNERRKYDEGEPTPRRIIHKRNPPRLLAGSRLDAFLEQLIWIYGNHALLLKKLLCYMRPSRRRVIHAPSSLDAVEEGGVVEVVGEPRVDDDLDEVLANASIRHYIFNF